MEASPGCGVGQKHGSHVSGSCQNGSPVTRTVGHQQYQHVGGYRSAHGVLNDEELGRSKDLYSLTLCSQKESQMGSIYTLSSFKNAPPLKNKEINHQVQVGNKLKILFKKNL